jgi:hypothetical protein
VASAGADRRAAASQSPPATMDPLLAAYRHTTKNRAEIEASTLCGCCACLATFAPDEIIGWGGLDMDSFDNPDAIAADAETALCPRCGAEAVIGDKSGFHPSPNFLGRMNQAWFQKTILRKPSSSSAP